MAMRIGSGVVLLVLVVGGVAWADGKILGGMPEYHMETLGPGDPRPPCGSSAAFAAASLDSDAQRPILNTNPLSEVPEYLWWYGCSPTSGGMMVGYWDGRPGFGNLYDGDASIWSGDGSQGTRSMVASTAHIVSGDENGYTYGDWHNSASYPSHEANPNCVADFMKTVNGGSYANNIAAGLEAYCEWDNPATPVNESYPATATNIDVPFYGGSFSYSDLKNEIDADRTVILDLICYTGYEWLGHSTVAYGYQDSMFQARVSTGEDYVDVVVGGFAVMDTWMNGTGQSGWVDWNWNTFGPVIDENGVEWWPFIELLGGSWYYDDGTVGPYDWMVTDAVTLEVTPEPATLGLLVLGGLALLARRRRK
jgi:hypothetical protein